MERICKECGYPLKGNEGICPECGCPIANTTSETPYITTTQSSSTIHDSDEYKTFSELFWSCQFYKIFRGHHFDLGQRTYESGVFLWEMIVITWHTVWGKFAQFTGRASRREYWSVCFGLPFLCIIPFFFIIALLPFIAVGIRRMHDTNHSGWWICVPFAIFFLSLKKSDPYENDYGVLENQ